MRPPDPFEALRDALGRLVDGTVQAGYYSIQWHGEDRHHRAVKNGIYRYRLETEDFVQIPRMLLLQCANPYR